MNKQLSSKRAQIFIVGVVIAISAGLISAYILLDYYFDDKSIDEHLGTYQSAMVDALIDGESTFIYVDNAAIFSGQEALHQFALNGGIYIAPELGSEDVIAHCGRYVYPLWTSEREECIKANEKTFSPFLNDAFNKQMTRLENINTNTRITYTLNYDATYNSTRIHARADNAYKFFVYKNRNYRESEETKEYVEQKIYAQGIGSYKYLANGDIPGIPFIDGSQRPRDGKKIDTIVIHYTAGSTIQSALDAWKTRDGVGAQYILGRDKPDHYALIQYSSDANRIGHAGCCLSASKCERPGMVCTNPKYADLNYRSIGIEVVNIGYLCNDINSCKVDQSTVFAKSSKTGSNPYYWQSYPEPQMKKLIALCGLLTKKYQIPIDREHIIGHEEVTKDKADPGPAFDWDKFIAEVKIANGKSEQELIAILNDGNIATTPGATAQCQTKDNNNWKISNIIVSPTIITADQSVTLIVTIENNGEECATVNAHPQIVGAASKILPISWPETKKNVYTTRDKEKYANFETICTFSTDQNVVDTAHKQGKCVLLAPKEGEGDLIYTIGARATDSKGKIVPTSITKTLKVSAQPKTATQQTPITSSITSATNLQTQVKLSAAEQSKFDSTKKNIERKNLMPFIDKYAAQYGIPKPIMLGKITVETGAQDQYQNACNSYGACGISQVVHTDKNGKLLHGAPNEAIHKACGRVYTKEEFMKDVDCQINAGAYILKEYYSQYGKKGTQIPSCLQEGGVQKYYEWEAALRAYNGLGASAMQCTDPLGQQNYVPLVMKYAQAWGYESTANIAYEKVSRDEIEAKGIIGTYAINPSFTTTIPFDMRLIDHLKIFAQSTIKNCNVSNTLPIDCVKKEMELFNNNTGKKYRIQGRMINLSFDCEPNWNQEQIALFLEGLEKCGASTMHTCQCMLPAPDVPVHINTTESGTQIIYTDRNGTIFVYESSVIITDAAQKPFSNEEYNLRNFAVYKSNINFTQKYVSGTDTCPVIENKVRLCLRTDYNNTRIVERNYEPALVNEPVIIKFALTLRDDIIPEPVTAVYAHAMTHKRNWIIVGWNASEEKDIIRYQIYVANRTQEITGKSIVDVRKDVPSVNIDIANGIYQTYQSIDETSEPLCELRSEQGGYACTFTHPVIEQDGSQKQVTLKPGIAYYLTQEERFIYIIEQVSGNALESNKEYTVLITAIDASGNEIETSKAILGTNMQTVVSQDLLEPAIPQVAGMIPAPDFKTYKINWVPVTIFIDGTPIINRKISYEIYANLGQCASSGLCEIRAPYAPLVKTEKNIEEVQAMIPPQYGVVAVDESLNNRYLQTRVIS